MLIEALSNIFSRDGESKQKKFQFKLFSKFNRASPNDICIANVIDWAKQKGYLARLGLTEESAERLFHSMLVDHDLPDELRANETLRKELRQVAFDTLGDRSPLSPEIAKRTLELIESGEVFQDIFYSVNVVFGLVINPGRFSNLDESFKSYLDAVIGLPESIILDLDPTTAFDKISDQIEQVKAGSSPDAPQILNNTLKTIYSTPDVGNTIEVVNALLAPENESLRIALLVYARLNGINLEQKDIDEVRKTILNRDDPKLGALFMYIVSSENAKRLAGG